MSTDRTHADQAAQDALTARDAVANGRLPLHGAAVERAGRTVVIAGTSGAGKSTLAAAAVLDGFGFVADEVAAVDTESLLVHPYHRPLGLRRGGRHLLGLPASEAESRPQPWLDPDRIRFADAAPLAAVVVLSDGPDETDTSEALSAASAMIELLQHLVAEDDELTACFDRLQRVVHRVPVVRVGRTSPAAGIQLLEELVGDG